MSSNEKAKKMTIEKMIEVLQGAKKKGLSDNEIMRLILYGEMDEALFDKYLRDRLISEQISTKGESFKAKTKKFWIRPKERERDIQKIMEVLQITNETREDVEKKYNDQEQSGTGEPEPGKLRSDNQEKIRQKYIRFIEAAKESGIPDEVIYERHFF